MGPSNHSPFRTAELAGEFQRGLDRARNVAGDVLAPVDVVAQVLVQAGHECLVADCPKCGQRAALSGEGRHLCRRCLTWLRYVRE